MPRGVAAVTLVSVVVLNSVTIAADLQAGAADEGLASTDVTPLCRTDI
jgi:hypothetical protein